MLNFVEITSAPADAPKISQFKDRMLSAECRNASAFQQNLNPGRSCVYSFSCKSARCKEGICVGRKKFEYCEDDRDCAAGYYCRT